MNHTHYTTAALLARGRERYRERYKADPPAASPPTAARSLIKGERPAAAPLPPPPRTCPGSHFGFAGSIAAR